jgi:hypothetical protein
MVLRAVVVVALVELLAGCVTCTQQVMQRDQEAGRGITDEESGGQEARDEKATELDVEAKIPMM